MWRWDVCAYTERGHLYMGWPCSLASPFSRLLTPPPPKLSTASQASPATNGNTCFPACFSTAGYSHPKSEKGSDVLPGANHGLWNLIRPTSQQEKVCRMLFRNGQTLQGMSSIINQACHRPLPPPHLPPSPPHPRHHLFYSLL